MWVAVSGDTGGYCWFASLSAMLRGKDDGGWVLSIRVTIDSFWNGGGGSLLLGKG